MKKILILALVVVLTAVGYLATQTDVLSRKHVSTTVVQIHPSMITITPSRSNGAGILMNTNYMENEFAMILDEITVSKMIEETGINAQWNLSTEEAIKRVQKMTETEPRRGTDFIAISARSVDPEEAKIVSQGGADAYIARRSDTEKKRAAKALKTLDEELQKHEDVVQERRTALTVLIGNYGIPYFDGKSASPVGLTEEEMYRKATEKLDVLEKNRDQLEIQINKILKSSPEELIGTVAKIELPENVVTGLHVRILGTENQLLKSGSTVSDQEKQALETKLSALKKKAAEEVVNLREVIRTRLALVDQQAAKMKEMVENKMADTVDLSMAQHQYNSAKDEYEQARDLYREMKLQQQEQRILLKMPRTPVTLHERAK